MSAADHIDFLKRLKVLGHEFEVIYDVGSNIGEWPVDVQELFPNARFDLFEALSDRNGMGDIKIRSAPQSDGSTYL